jgi:hypothetical protein
MPYVLPLALCKADATVLGSVGAAFVAAMVALYLNWRGRKDARAEQRRDLYSEAFRTGLEWCEGVYRVRRRPPDGSGDSELVQRFHDLQERIAYHEGWLAAEAAELGRAYSAFLRSVLHECRPLIQDAWSRDGRAPTEQTPDGEESPNVDDAKQAFLRDLRDHQSRAPWIRRRVKNRYPEKN